MRVANLWVAGVFAAGCAFLCFSSGCTKAVKLSSEGLERLENATVAIKCDPGAKPGSGVLVAITKTGDAAAPVEAVVLTRCHVIAKDRIGLRSGLDENQVIKPHEDIKVRIPGYKQFKPADVKLKYVEDDPEIDLALLFVPLSAGAEEKLKDQLITYTDIEKLKKSDTVFGYGFPGTEEGVLVTGPVMTEPASSDGFFYFDATVHNGHSGGPVVNAKGNMVGLIKGIGRLENDSTYAMATNIRVVKNEVNPWLDDKRSLTVTSKLKYDPEHSWLGKLIRKKRVSIPIVGCLIAGTVWALVQYYSDGDEQPQDLPWPPSLP